MKKILDIILKVIFVLCFVFSLTLFYKVDIFPLNYKIVFISVFIIIFILNFISLILKKKLLNIISNIFNIIFILFILLISTYLFKTNDFLDKLLGNELSETYYLAVVTDKKYQSIDELNNLKIGAFYNNLDTYELALKNINRKIKAELINYEDIETLTNALLNNELEAILIDESSKKIIEEEYELVYIQLRYIYNVTTKTKVNDIAKDVDVVEKPFVFYISGIDAYGDIEAISRSDVNIIAVINPKEHKVLLVTIPRDYYVDIYGKNAKDKLTHAGIYGVESSIKTIENLLDVDINYYLKINFSTLIKAVDAVGGVNVYSEYTFNTYGTQFYKGYNYMNGEKALAFSRARYNFAAGDRVRGENQMRVIEGIIDKLSSSRVLVTNYLDILDTLEGSFQTNVDSNRIYDLVKFQLYNMPKWTVETYSLNGYDSYEYTYTSKKSKRYVMKPNIDTVNAAKKKIVDLMN